MTPPRRLYRPQVISIRVYQGEVVISADESFRTPELPHGKRLYTLPLDRATIVAALDAYLKLILQEGP